MHSEAEQKRLLVLMAKQPEPGKTKTRLSPLLDATEAAALYSCFLIDKITTMQTIDIALPAVAYSPQKARHYFEKFAPDLFLIPQKGANLAQSLCNIFEVTLSMGFEQVLAIDGDSPDLPASYLRGAFQALDDHQIDVALGPTDDGGYYAIGMRKLHRTLFEATMSTPSVYNDTLALAEGAGLKIASLPRWYDVDRPEDLERLRGSLASGAVEGARATTAFLNQLKPDRGTQGPHVLNIQPD
jgi:rSAM/selenodomain-associated transferase 1